MITKITSIIETEHQILFWLYIEKFYSLYIWDFIKIIPTNSLIFLLKICIYTPIMSSKESIYHPRRSSWRTDEGFRLVYILSSVKRLNVWEEEVEKREEEYRKTERERERQKVKKRVIGPRFVKSEKRIPPSFGAGLHPFSFSREHFMGENSTFTRRFLNSFRNPEQIYSWMAK